MADCTRQLKKANLLIAECRQLWTSKDIDGSTTWAGTVKKLKQRMVDFLLRLGTDYDDIRREINKISFTQKILEPEVDEEGVPNGQWRSVRAVNRPQVRRATKLLVTAAKRLKDKCSVDEHNVTYNALSAKTSSQKLIVPVHRHVPQNRKVENHNQSELAVYTANQRGKRGPQAMDHAKIKTIAESLAPWRNRLTDLCDQLDEERISVSRQYIRKLQAKGVRKPSWSDMLEHYEGPVIKAIERSRRVAAKTLT